MSYFHLLIGEMIITLDDISCLLHLPIRGKLLGHRRVNREEFIEMMVTHLGANQARETNEVADTRGTHARFRFLEQLYKNYLQ